MKRIVKVYYVLEEDDVKSIKKQLIDLGVTLRQMARNLGISPAYLSDIINGGRHITERIREQFKSQGIVLGGVGNEEM